MNTNYKASEKITSVRRLVSKCDRALIESMATLPYKDPIARD